MTPPFYRFLTLFGAALALSACVLRPPDPLPLTRGCIDAPLIAPEDEAQHLSFFYTSALPDCRNGDLKLNGFRHPESTFGTGTYGFVENEPQDPSLRRHNEGEWFAALQQAIDEPAAQKRLIIFIHGYATTFNEAHMDAAEVRALAGENVPVVVLHWPSRGAVSGYINDRASIAWAQDRMTRTIARLLPMADDVSLVSHSLGAQAVLNAVIALDRKGAAGSENIKRIALASPDIDRHQALRAGGTVDQVLTDRRKVLIYASERDKALQVSRNLNGYSRLGSTNCKFDVVFDRRALGSKGNCHLTAPRNGLAIVDTGPSDAEGLVRHNDFLKSCQVREDLKAFLRDEAPPPYRELITRDGLTGFSIDPRMDFDGAPCDPIM